MHCTNTHIYMNACRASKYYVDLTKLHHLCAWEIRPKSRAVYNQYTGTGLCCHAGRESWWTFSVYNFTSSVYDDCLCMYVRMCCESVCYVLCIRTLSWFKLFIFYYCSWALDISLGVGCFSWNWVSVFFFCFFSIFTVRDT